MAFHPKRRKRFRRGRRRKKKRRMSVKKIVRKEIAKNIETKSMFEDALDVQASSSVARIIMPEPVKGLDHDDRIGSEIRGRMLELNMSWRGAEGVTNTNLYHEIGIWFLYKKDPGQVAILPALWTIEPWRYDKNPGIAVIWHKRMFLSSQTRAIAGNNRVPPADNVETRNTPATNRLIKKRFNLKNRKMKFVQLSDTISEGRYILVIAATDALSAGTNAEVDVGVKFWYKDA